MYVKRIEEIEPEENQGNWVRALIPESLTQGVVIKCQEVKESTESHSHPEIEQIYIIRSGKGLIVVGDEERIVEKDEVIYIPPGAQHGIRRVGTRIPPTSISATTWRTEFKNRSHQRSNPERQSLRQRRSLPLNN